MEVQHFGAAGQIVKVYVEVFVEMYAHTIWIFVSSGAISLLNWREILVDDEGSTTVGSSYGSATGSWMIIGCTCGS